MDQRPDKRPRRHHETTARRDAARFVRAEVVDVLADGLLALILAGKRPGGSGSGAPPAASAALCVSGSRPSQHVETAGV